MHFVICGLSGKHGGTDTLSKDWLNVVFSIYYGRNNDVDLPEVLWLDFCKFAIKRKPNEISSPIFWGLTIEQIFKELNVPISVSTIPPKVCVSFKLVKSYRILDQSSFSLVRQLMDNVLALIPSGSPFLKHHLETSVVFDPTQPAPVSVEPISEEATHTMSGPMVKKPAKQKASPTKPKPKRKPKSLPLSTGGHP